MTVTAICAVTDTAWAQQVIPAAQAGVSTPTTRADTRPATSEESVIVTGTRVTGKLARQSLSPIDVVSSRALRETGQNNLRDALMQLLPSVNRQTQGTTVGALTDSINLRGLSPNETLVLVNGKRRHTTTNTQTDAGPFRGATPVDIDLIPISMVDHIEVLRDGASAQYGSDAVAGVINIILKTSDHGGSFNEESGAYAAGDGFTQNIDLDHGFSLGSRGYVHLGLSYQHHERTDRTGIDGRTGLFDSHWIGEPLSDRISVAAQGAYRLTGGIESYGLLTYAHRDASTFQIYRLPSILRPIYANGFSPKLEIDENDYAATAGFRGDDLAGWHWDFSSTFGTDRSNIDMSNSANTSLYALTGSTPQSFHLTDSATVQVTTDLDLKRRFAPSFYRFPIDIAVGAEHRFESYSVGSGSYASYAVGGSQSVPGTQPQSAGPHSRDVYAVYADLATKLTDKWQVDAAGRLEHYTDFGDTGSAKLSTRYDFNRVVGFRSTISNGIRAPTLAEEHHTSATVTTSGATGELAPSSAGAQVLGANALKPERSTSVTAGLTFHPIRNLDVAIDGYQIDIRDRILDGGTYNGALALAAFAADGRTLPTGVASSAVSASYLTNAASTRTRGVDITSNYRIDLASAGFLVLDAALNLNETTIRHTNTNRFGRSDLNLQQVGYLTTDAPHNVVILGGNWTFQKWNLSIHEMRYGHIFDQMTYQQGANAFSSSVFQAYTLRPRYLTNILVSYHATDRLTVSAGANNLFNTYPNKVPVLASYYNQVKYDRYAQQIGFNGGFYYLNVGYKF
ncbi:TonB-dependent receptor [Lichenicola cladoniae]|uniref:TonB-dependent receptor n=1 Tax=Lichenicola cladoniae TaxID=1484109 RepID=A0A6M8HHL3_9PROT|nr:TonB-dependent receptor [Lichenicola cladoniae]NPD65234.1 TonB-dependent receptor [Acetobacteraceae bacterium]QKE88829.1 TonB-dependent receptor [Lichenicola cladoniae]